MPTLANIPAFLPVIHAVLLCLLIILIAVLACKVLSIGYKRLCISVTLRNHLAYFFGYNLEQRLTEFLILKYLLQSLVVMFSLYLLLQVINIRLSVIDSVYSAVFNGFSVANMSLYPIRIVLGILLACLLYLAARLLATRVRRHEVGAEEDKQVAIASILSYVGFAFAFIAGLSVAGFNFTNLAIIAGALSVGIGLGLQNIVNHFFSGLILLIEKPIKPGDRIQIEGAEGVVKKISIRATQITTPAYEDIIIPNADLITRRVTNYTYANKHLTISCQVNVVYGTDPQLVRSLLLQVAAEHEAVLQTSNYKPAVFFLSFGENALLFQLNCVIKDANKKAYVRSDLHYAIERIFQQNHIAMSHPKSEVYLHVASKQKEILVTEE